jgi:ParB family chromosome partitioning protein
MKLPLDEIRVNGRHRKDLGDIAELARSISDVGLLHPVVITPENELIAGQRRLEAVRILGWDDVPVTVVSDFTEAAQALRAERDENTCRKDFTPSEAIALGKALEPMFREEAKGRQKQSPGRPKKGEKKELTFSRKDDGKTGRAGAEAAEAVGMSWPTYKRAKAVIEAAESDPETFGPIAEEMDRTGKITPAYEQLQRAQVSEAVPDTTRPGVGVERANEAINALKRIPKNDPLRKRGFQIVTDWIRANK